MGRGGRVTSGGYLGREPVNLERLPTDGDRTGVPVRLGNLTRPREEKAEWVSGRWVGCATGAVERRRPEGSHVAAEHDRRLAEYEHQVGDLQDQVKSLEEEVVGLRRRLQDAPKRVRTLEERLLETKGQLAQALSQNEKLSATLREARAHIAALREEVEKLTMPPSGYGTYLATNDDGSIDVFTAGRKMRVSLHPQVDASELHKGQEVVLNESFNVVLARAIDLNGEVVTLKEVLE